MDWKAVVNSFLMKYCGHGISVGRQYYHAKKRSDETLLEFLYRLNVIGMQAKISVKDGSPEGRKEHVDHFIEALEDRELANQLLLLRLKDADDLETTLCEYEKGQSRRGNAVMGSSKFRQKFSPNPTPAPSKPTRAVRAICVENESSSSEMESSGSESESDLRAVYVANASDRQPPDNDLSTRSRSTKPGERMEPPDRGEAAKPCTHCGSTKHNNLGCWKRLTCQKCGRKGHPSDNCFFVCRGCGKMHDTGKCPLEEFYNMIHQWYVPTKHAGMLPDKVEKMLN